MLRSSSVLRSANIIHLAGISCKVLSTGLILIADRRETARAANLVHLAGIPCVVLSW